MEQILARTYEGHAHESIMRVLAASFPDGASARAARAKLIEAFELDASQIGVEALAHEQDVRDEAVLAGRFREDVVDAARDVVQRSGGKLVIDIDDRAGNA